MINDLRRNDFYLTDEEKKEWDNRNILYNTIWFFLNKKYFPDIEYCDAAIKAYKKLDCYKDCTILYHTNVGKVLVSNNGEVLSADLMTGWWNPVSYYLGWTNRKSITKELLDSIPVAKDDEKVISWITENKSKDNSSAKALLDFLGVIYTEGNIIPSPVNWKGRGIDAWPYKVEKIIDAFKTEKKEEKKLYDAIAWGKYICDNYEGIDQIQKFNDFIKQNKLEMYIKDNEIISFWDKNNKPNKWTDATDEQWKDFFNNAKKAIEDRYKSINCNSQ